MKQEEVSTRRELLGDLAVAEFVRALKARPRRPDEEERNEGEEADEDHRRATIALGASVCCAGACLTAVETGPDWFAVNVSAETLSKTLHDVLRGVGTRAES